LWWLWSDWVAVAVAHKNLCETCVMYYIKDHATPRLLMDGNSIEI
jgi:hypothetical protein